MLATARVQWNNKRIADRHHESSAAIIWLKPWPQTKTFAKTGAMFLFSPKDFRQDLDDLKKGDFDSRMKGIAEDHRWVSKLRDIVDSVAFKDAGRPFHLEVVNVTSSPSDNRKVALRVCED